MMVAAGKRAGAASRDQEHMRELCLFTARTFDTAHPVPYGALIVQTQTGKRVMRATNRVVRENDPSSHAEVRAVRLACKKLKRASLKGYTMYSTCEPCAMCMANAIWANLDRVVFGATIADGARYCFQIHVPARLIARGADVHCVVDGPVQRELCCALFTHPKMQQAFRTWSLGKRNLAKP